jgi:hypothetical protein
MTMRYRSHPNHWLAGLAALAITACGGDTPTDPDRPDVASLAVHAGAGQTAATSTPVPVNPEVIARDAQGRAISGVRVNFSVTQGAGAIGVAGVNTDENGVASPGQWTLGPTPGPQALRAQFADSDVPAVTISATAVAAELVLTTQVVSSAGGTITVNRPGSTLHGASLQFGAGAVAGATSVTLLESSVAGVQLPAGVQAVSSGLGIASSGGRLQGGALVTFPATPVSGKLLMVALANPRTGAVTLLPLTSQDPQSVGAALPSLNSTALPGLRASMSSDNELTALTLLVAINEELLAVDYNTGFRPSVDSWDFPAMALADLPFLYRVNDGSYSYSVLYDGWISTALWYYVNKKKTGSPKLNGLTQEAAGEPLSSRLGIRWAALAEKDVPPVNQVGSLVVKEWTDWATDDRKRFSWLQFRAIKALMLTTLKNPVPVVLLDTDNPDQFNDESHPFAIAYKTVGNMLHLVSPLDPGSEIIVPFSETEGMAPFGIQTPGGAIMTVRAIAGVHYVNVVDDAKLSAQWSRVADETIGKAEGWPTPTLHWEKAKLDTAKVYLLDELQHWWQCAGCTSVLPTPAHLPATASHVQRYQAGTYTGTAFGGLSGMFSSASLSAEDTFEETQTMEKKGFLVRHPFGSDVELGTAVGWLDWVDVTYRKMTLAPSVDEITFSKDTTINVTVVPSEAPPAGTRYRWKLRTEDGQDSVETTTPTHTRELEAGADGWLIITALEGEHKRPIARDSIRIEPGGAAPYWRITSFTGDANFLEDDPEEPNPPELNAMLRVFGTPTAGLIAIEEVGGVSELRLRARRNAIWDGESCCPPAAYDPATEWLLPLGHSVVRNHPVGPFFGGWGTSFWSQSSQDLGAGSMTGQWVQSTVPYQIPDQGTQSGPDGGVRFTATRNGTTMTGQIVVWAWAVDSETGEVEEVLSYVYQFTAIRMQ